MKTTVIYHSADFDGIFCREISRKFLPEAELIGWDFTDDALPIIEEGNIYILDLPVDRVFGWNFAKGIYPAGFLSRVVWIDHHKSSIETHPTEIAGYRIDGVAACRLAWQWFTKVSELNEFTLHQAPQKRDFIDCRVAEPYAVQLAGEYDVFDKRDGNAELFQFGLKSQPLTNEHWAALLSMDSDGMRFSRKLLYQGEPLAYARANEYRDVITQQGFDLQFEGLCFLACNSHELDIRSQLFEAGIKPHHDGLLGFSFNGKDWRVSMYGVPSKPDIDFSVIAKKYGGGGHRQACGFTGTMQWWQAVVISLFMS
jgi:hypothetical protein